MPKNVPVTVEFIPLRETLKIFFEAPDVFESVVNYIIFLKGEKNVICNFMQGTLWAQLHDVSLDTENEITLSLGMYFDDYENNNPLGRHR